MNQEETITVSYSKMLKIAGVIILFIIAIMSFKAFGQDSGNTVSIDTGKAVEGEVVNANMKVVNGEYIIEPNTFKVGQKVRITADISKIPGCAKSIVISAFGVRKTLTQSNNIIEFTPTKAGTFFITCSMNMYQGQFTVIAEDGTKAAYVEEKPASTGHTCGGGGSGGCGGCGG